MLFLVYNFPWKRWKFNELKVTEECVLSFVFFPITFDPWMSIVRVYMHIRYDVHT